MKCPRILIRSGKLAEQDVCIRMPERRVPECLRQRSDDSETQLLPEPHCWCVGRYDEVELHRQEGLIERECFSHRAMRAPTPGQSAAGAIRSRSHARRRPGSGWAFRPARTERNQIRDGAAGDGLESATLIRAALSRRVPGANELALSQSRSKAHHLPRRVRRSSSGLRRAPNPRRL